MMNQYRSTTEWSARAAVLAVLVVLVVLVVFWMRSASSPVKVLGCTWERATVDGTATTSPRCLP